jgi:hypothetical protein
VLAVWLSVLGMLFAWVVLQREWGAASDPGRRKHGVGYFNQAKPE